MTDAAANVAGVVLAAGSSQRLGRDKLYVRLDGETLLRRAARLAVDAGLAPVVVVAGPRPDAARRELAGVACEVVVNPDHAAGMGVSLAVGVRAVSERAAAAVALLADMPRVDRAMIDALVERHRRTRAALVISRYGEEIAPPILYGRALFPELLELTGDVGGKPVIRRHLAAAEVVEWPASRARDVDVAADLERLDG